MLTQDEIEDLIESEAPRIAREIATAAQYTANEAEFRAPVERLIDDFAHKLELDLRVEREKPVVRGRADAVYNRFVIEFERPGYLHRSSTNANTKHAVQQVIDYAEDISKIEKRKIERMAGAALDGNLIVFVRWLEGKVRVDDPLPVTPPSVATLLKYIVSLSTELALTPEYLIRDFGENTQIARGCVNAMYQTLAQSATPKTNILFQQWSMQFGEAVGYSESGKLDVKALLDKYGIRDRNPDPLRVLFALHSYYAVFIKTLAVQIALYYTKADESQPSLSHVASYAGDALRVYLTKMERGGVFVDLGISNFLEGDFFGWYLDAWNPQIESGIRRMLAKLAEYSLVTLDVDPDETRDLLKHLYQNLMPRELRHQLGEYYTPDWLAERLLNQLGYDGDPKLRILDPACGSGTFCVLEIKRLRAWIREHAPTTPPARELKAILQNIVGFDLNPLAVISARVNYLLAMGDLIKARSEQFAIPIYMCDSIMTPSAGGLLAQDTIQFPTAVGMFSVPHALGQTADDIEKLATLLEECVEQQVGVDVFQARLTKAFAKLESDDRAVEISVELFEKLRELDSKQINGIWARIIKNAFAPLFVGEFEFVAGNPPWVNWESLPDEYRRRTAPLWNEYALFPHKGYDAILGKCKDDISVLMTYVAIDKYLKPSGTLGFIITQSVLKSAGGGEGFRRFRIGREGEFVRPVHVDDMVALQPFASASNRTIVIVLKKGEQAKYPVPYSQWHRTVFGKRIPEDATLELVSDMASFRKLVAEPVDKKKSSSSWITGRPKALSAVRKLLGLSDYVGRAGVCNWLNGVYWVKSITKRPDGLILIANSTESGKERVDDVQAAVESDLLYPLLRAGEVKRWDTSSELSILMPHISGERLNAIPEATLAKYFPKTFAYFRRFESQLRGRSGFKRFFKPTSPFYSLYNCGDYTFAPNKVVWGNIASSIEAAVISSLDKKVVVPQHTVTLIPFDTETEAHYVCAVLNSSPFNFAVQSYSQKGGKSFGTPGILENVRVPKYDPKNNAHLQLAKLSQAAHATASSDDEKRADKIAEIEAEIDIWAAQVWGLTDEELRDIQKSLKELG